MVAVDPIQRIWLYCKRIDTMAFILPLCFIVFFLVSLAISSRQIPHFIPYNTSSDELSIHAIHLPMDYLERASLGLMTSFFSAWLVKYIIETSASRRDRKIRLMRAYRGIYSLIAIVIEAAITQFIYATKGTVHDPVYFDRLRSIHYSHEMIDPVLSRRIPAHDSTVDMSSCVNNISIELNSDDSKIIKIWPSFYINFKGQIEGYLQRGKREIIEGAISDAISLGDSGTIGVISAFSAFTEQILSGGWDHFTPEESIKHIDFYLKEAIKLAELVGKDADLVKVTFEADKQIERNIIKP